MARRATYFKEVYQPESPTLKIAGGFEFVHRAGPAPTADFLQAMGKAFTFLEYDAGLLTAREQEMFEKAKVVPPSPWKTCKQAPYRELSLENGKKVGVIVFPPLPEDSDIPDEATFKAIAAMVLKAKPKVDLLVALSDWGIVGEREYLAAKPVDAPHMLLGSGSGTGIRGQIMADGRIFYARSYDKGKAINQIEISDWPASRGDFAWISNDNIISTLITLDNRYYDSLKIDEIFSNVDLSNN